MSMVPQSDYKSASSQFKKNGVLYIIWATEAYTSTFFVVLNEVPVQITVQVPNREISNGCSFK